MGIFATHRALTRLSKELRELGDAVAKLETANKRLGLEWEELYDKVRHQMSRMARRQAIDKAANGDLFEGMDDPAGLAGMDPISAKIHARRGLPRKTE